MVPITKNDISEKANQYKGGATPIEKNVIVVDEQGNEYEATYPKRAKGLVKNGRARFVDENKICLACPPDKILEEEKVEENKLTAREIFEAIDALTKGSGHLESALKQLETVRSDGIGDIGAQARAQAIAKTVECRETTIQKVLSMYMKMYDDLQQDSVAIKLQLIKSAFDNNMATIKDSDMETQDKFAALGYVTDKIAELVEKVVINEELVEKVVINKEG